MILKRIRNILRWVVVLFFSTTILAVVVYRFLPVYFTPLMFIRCFQQVADGESITLHHHWVSMDKISPHMPVAVMASEDGRFLKHHGFDFNAIENVNIGFTCTDMRKGIFEMQGCHLHFFFLLGKTYFYIYHSCSFMVIL